VDCEILLIAPFKKKKIVSSKDVYGHTFLYPRSPKGEGGILFYLCTSVRPSKIFFGAFFSVTVDGRNLIFGHKHHIGINVYRNQLSRQTGSRNVTGPKTLPTIWHTYMKLVTKYQIPVINSCFSQ
jgi:hypothetical protein